MNGFEIGLLVAAGIFVALGAIIYHFAHKTTLASSIGSQVAAAASAKVAEVLGQAPPKA